MINDVKLAEEAFALCKNAFENSDYEMARIYCLNAITHNHNIDYFKSLAAIAGKFPAEEQSEAIDQTLNILQMAMLQIPASDIIAVKEIIDALNLQLSSLSLSKIESSSQNSSADIEVLHEITQGAYSWKHLEYIKKIDDPETIQERIVILQNFLNNESLAADSEKAVNDELQNTTVYLEYIGIKKSVEQYLTEAKHEMSKADYDSQYVVCRLQQVSTLLAQLWLFDVNSVIGREKYSEQLRKLQKSCTELEKEFLEKESEPLCMEIKKDISAEIARAEKYSNAKFTAVIDILQRRYGEISAKISEIPLKSKIIEMQSELQKLAEVINELSKKRYAAYQKKCAKICRTAIQNFEDMTFVWEKDAQEILCKNPLHTINEALISPETASILQMTKQILEEKLSKLNKADFAVKCVEADKMKLEDF